MGQKQEKLGQPNSFANAVLIIKIMYIVGEYTWEVAEILSQKKNQFLQLF